MSTMATKSMDRYRKDFEKLYVTSALSDLAINIGEETILAHKNILCARNSTFATMFSRSLSALRCVAVNIPNVDPKVFRTFIKYLYTCSVEEKDISEFLLEVAYKFADATLKNICEDHLCKNIDERNAIAYLLVAILYDCDKLKKVASDFVASRYDSMMISDNFGRLLKCREAVVAVLGAFNEIVKGSEEKAQQFSDSFKMEPNRKSPVGIAFNVGNVPWIIGITHKSVSNNKWLRIGVRCCDQRPSFSYTVSYSIKLVCHSQETDSIIHSHDAWKCSRAFRYKAHSFISLSELTDAKNGYVDDKGLITVILDIKVDKK